MRRLPILSLLIALALPAGAGAATQHFSTVHSSDGSLSPHAALRKADAAVAGRGQTADLTPLLKQVAAGYPSLNGRDRERAHRLLARPTQGEATSSETPYSVAEQPPKCSEHFCIHWVASTDDAPAGDAAQQAQYVQMMDDIFEHVYQVENVQMGWKVPRPDGSKGCPNSASDCLNKTDVYLKNIGDQGIYGYAAPDPNQKTFSQAAYLVMDNDYLEPVFTSRYPDGPAQPAEVTAAHEYNHVLQFGYDVVQDTWMFESTAVWMEDKVYTDVNDYLQYLGPWAQLTALPITSFNAQNSNAPENVKVYGDMVWNRWIDAKYGQDTIRSAWEHSLTSKPKASFAPGSYDQALGARGTSFYNAFTSFAADTAEWRATNTPFPEGNTFPDIERAAISGRLIHLTANGSGVGGRLDHTAYALFDVTPTSAGKVKLVLDTPRGKRMALALVGRVGDSTSGNFTVRLKRIKKGGTGTVTLPNPGQYTRITAAVINGDARTTGRFSQTIQDWQWVSDSVPVAARLSTDFTPPRIVHRSPVPHKRGVSRRAPVKVRFSERMVGLAKSTAVLVDSRGHRVAARVAPSSHVGKSLVIRPSHALRAHRRYVVKLSNLIEDRGGNKLPASSRSWSFTTAR